MTQYSHLFPKDFFWGTSTAAYQIEGAWNLDGKGESIWDTFAHRQGTILNGDTGDVSCDHYHLWKEDIQFMKNLGVNAYRFSLSWPRILPEGRGQSNAQGLDFYDNLVDELLANDIVPLVTLYHWDLPQRLQDAGGWLNRRTGQWFADYAEIASRRLGDRVIWWITINEANVVSYCGFMAGTHAPGVKDEATCQQVSHHLLLAHGQATQALRGISSTFKIGFAPNMAVHFPADTSPEAEAKAFSDWSQSSLWSTDPVLLGRYPEAIFEEYTRRGVAPIVLSGDFEIIKQPLDFFGLNHYFSRFQGDPPPEAKRTDWNAFDYPLGLSTLLFKLRERYGDIPFLITENGLPQTDERLVDGQIHDQARVNYLEGYIGALADALQTGVKVFGYCVWSFMDNLEWAEGYHLRFGLVHVNFKTFKRTIKDSGYWYRDLIRSTSNHRQ